MTDQDTLKKIIEAQTKKDGQLPCNDNQRMIVRQSSLKAAIEFRGNEEGVGIPELLSFAEQFEDWVLRKF